MRRRKRPLTKMSQEDIIGERIPGIEDITIITLVDIITRDQAREIIRDAEATAGIAVGMRESQRDIMIEMRRTIAKGGGLTDADPDPERKE
jgi:hypothetical protein